MSEKFIDPKERGIISGIALIFNRTVSVSIDATEVVSNTTEMASLASDMGVTSFRSKHKVHYYMTLANEEDQLAELRASHPLLFTE